MAWLAGFGNAHDKKNLFKINDLPLMTQMAWQKWQGVDFGRQERKKEGEK